MSQEKLSVIGRIYEAFGRGDIPAVLELFAPSFEWFAADNSPLADRSPYRGVDDVRDGVFHRIGADFPGLTIRVEELFGAGDRVVMLGVYDGVRRSTGRRFRAQVAHIWTVADGKAVRFQQYTDTFAIARSAESSDNVGE